MRTPLLRSCLTLTLVASAARAGQVEYFGSVVMQPLPWNATATFPKFDPALGQLRVVHVRATGFVQGTLGVENTSATPSGAHAVPHANIFVSGPAGSFGLSPSWDDYPLGITLAAYDGVTDYAGPSGRTDSFGPTAGGSGNPSDDYAVYWGSGLDLYIGAGGTFDLSLQAMQGSVSLPPWIAWSLQESASLTLAVRYEFDSYPAVFCVPPAFTSACPCMNWSFPPNGCANSVNSSGGALGASGAASLSSDTLVLHGSGMTPSSALYFQGASASQSGSAFGDGVRCVSGSIVRLRTTTNLAGASQFPAAGDPSISVSGGVTTPGSLRYYQVMYRDNGSFCTPDTFNFTSGVSVRWDL